MARILIIEDSKDVNLLLKESLESEGHQVDSSYDGRAGMKALKDKVYDVLLLDLMLPYMSGDSIVRELRTFSNMPILVLSAKDTVITKIDLIKLGADDYMTKPFDLGEVSVRVEALLRRIHNAQVIESDITYKDMVLKEQEKSVFVKESKLELTAKEYQMLALLLNHPNKVFSKANLYESLWEEEYLGDDNTIKAHISNLRSKLKKANPKEDYIETVWGFGYRLHK